MQPEAAEIRYFVDRIHEIEKREAVNHYIRTGRAWQVTPDPAVARVLEWLESLATG